MHIIFTQPVPWFSTPFSVSLRPPFGLTALAKATLKGLGLDGLTEHLLSYK